MKRAVIVGAACGGESVMVDGRFATGARLRREGVSAAQARGRSQLIVGDSTGRRQPMRETGGALVDPIADLAVSAIYERARVDPEHPTGWVDPAVALFGAGCIRLAERHELSGRSAGVGGRRLWRVRLQLTDVAEGIEAEVPESDLPPDRAHVRLLASERDRARQAAQRQRRLPLMTPYQSGNACETMGISQRTLPDWRPPWATRRARAL